MAGDKREGEQAAVDKKRRKLAVFEVKATIYIEDKHAHNVNDEAFVTWQNNVQKALKTCQDEMKCTGKVLDRACPGTGLQCAIDTSCWCQRRGDNNPH